MFLICQVVFVWAICLSFKVVLTGCDVVMVNRNVTDSFCVGEDGCKNDTSVCKSNAVCQSDGSCLCKSETPSYRNPVLKFKDSEIVYNNSYGCIDNEIIRFGAGNKSSFCYFSPFQVIPYSSNEPGTEFSYDINSNELRNCSVLDAWVKFPNNRTEIKLPWLNESFINLTVLNNNTIYFRWKRSVSNLQGTIITFNIMCTNKILVSFFTCIRAKVFGTWPANVYPVTSFLPKTNASVAMTTATTEKQSHASTSDQMSLTRSDLDPVLSSNDDSNSNDSSSTTIVLTIVIPVGVLILLVIVIWCCYNRKKRNRQRNPSVKNSEEKNENSIKRPFRHTESNLRGPIAYDDLPESDTSETFGAHANPTCPTTDNHSVIVKANPCYGTADVQKNDEVNFYSDPDFESEDILDNVSASTFKSDPNYATVDIKRKNVDGSNSYADSSYETPDVKRKYFNTTNSYLDTRIIGASSKLDPDYATVDNEKKNDDDNSSFADQGYATPDVKREGFDSTNFYVDPNYESVDVKMKGLNEASSKSDSDYATVDVKRKDVDGNNSYAESGYETADIKRKDLDGATSITENNYESIAELVDPIVKNKDENATTYQPELGRDTRRKKLNGDSSNFVHNDIRNIEENAVHLPSDNIKRIEINGDLYALPNK